jgi:hypothetical protein
MNQQKYDYLVKFLKNIPKKMKNKLDELKKAGYKQSQRDDFLWFSLLQSFATMGNSHGWTGLFETSQNYNRITNSFIKENLKDEQLIKHFAQVLWDAKVRMPNKKATWLAKNYSIIEDLGGIESANKQAFALQSRAAKIEFMKQFDGIGDKYARNIWMDIYDPHFHNSIALDERIKKVSNLLEISFINYSDHEQFYLDIAKKTNLQGWELDRLLYNYNNEIVQIIMS